MKASELRIDNFIKIPAGKVRCTSIIINKIDRLILNNNAKAYKYKPIELNNQWIEAASIDISGLSLYEKNGVFYFDVNGFKVIISYVHQLQNIYFALTGKELF